MKRAAMIISMFLFALLLTGCMNKASGSNEQELQAPKKTEETTNADTKSESKPSTKDIEIIKDERKGIIPVSIEIPAIDVKTKVEHVGTLKDGRMDVPKEPSNVGWYQPGTKPGAQGNAVIAGHVDDLVNPAVFYDLNKLKKGDKIYIKGKSGDTLTFEVYGSKIFPRSDAPIENIFGFTYRSALNLITCTGKYNPDTTERAERLVVSAELVQKK